MTEEPTKTRPQAISDEAPGAWRRLLGSERAAGALCLVAAALIGLKLTAFIEAVRDIGLNDETLYLASGVRLLHPGYPNMQNGLPPADWSPIYALSYRLLYAIEPDRTAIYYLNWKVLVTGSTVALYLFQRSLRIGPLLALTTCFFFATSDYFEVWPYPMHFAVLLLLLGATVAARVRSRVSGATALAVTFILAAYVRPELSLAALLSLGMWVFVAQKEIRARSRGWGRTALQGALLAAFAAGLASTFGNPLGGGRSFYAWGQHYAADVATSEGLKIDPWLHWHELVVRDFGDASTLGAAAHANPGAFARHVVHNLMATPSALSHVAEPHLFLPRLPTAVAAALIVCLAIVALAAVVGLRSAWRPASRASRQNPLVVLAMVTALVLVSISGGMVLVYPRDHYLLPVAVLLAVHVGVGLSALRRRRLRSPGAVALGLAALLLVVTPNRAHGWSPQTALFHTGAPDLRLPVRSTIHELQRLGIERHVVALELGWGYVFYAGYDADRVVEWAKNKPFLEYIRDMDISVMVLTDDFLHHPQFESDPDYRAFLADPARYGYRVISVPQSTTQIVVRRDMDPG